MRLDMAAQRALHVLPARAEARGNSTSSVYGILNHTRTAMGKRLLRSWLKQPLTDVVAISERHTIVQAFVDDLEMRCDSPHLSCILKLSLQHRSAAQQVFEGLVRSVGSGCLLYSILPVARVSGMQLHGCDECAGRQCEIAICGG